MKYTDGLLAKINEFIFDTSAIVDIDIRNRYKLLPSNTQDDIIKFIDRQICEFQDTTGSEARRTYQRLIHLRIAVSNINDVLGLSDSRIRDVSEQSIQIANYLMGGVQIGPTPLEEFIGNVLTNADLKQREIEQVRNIIEYYSDFRHRALHLFRKGKLPKFINIDWELSEFEIAKYENLVKAISYIMASMDQAAIDALPVNQLKATIRNYLLEQCDDADGKLVIDFIQMNVPERDIILEFLENIASTRIFTEISQSRFDVLWSVMLQMDRAKRSTPIDILDTLLEHTDVSSSYNINALHKYSPSDQKFAFVLLLKDYTNVADSRDWVRYITTLYRCNEKTIDIGSVIDIIEFYSSKASLAAKCNSGTPYDFELDITIMPFVEWCHALIRILKDI